MRGEIDPQASMFSYVDLESRIPQGHPIRKIRKIVDQALEEIEVFFDDLYAAGGRPSIPPEMLLRASLLQILVTVRSERQLYERIEYDLMFRWFVGLRMDDPMSMTRSKRSNLEAAFYYSHQPSRQTGVAMDTIMTRDFLPERHEKKTKYSDAMMSAISVHRRRQPTSASTLTL